MQVWRLAVALVLAGFAVLLVAPIGIAALSPSDPRVIEEQNGAATIYFAVDQQRVLGYGSCQQVTWRLEGIQAVMLNDAGVTGEGSREICGTSPWLEVFFQDGSAKYYWLKRDIVFTAEARLAVLLALALVLSIPFALGLRVRSWLGSRSIPGAKTLVRAANMVRREPRGPLYLLLAITLVGVGIRLLYVNTPIWIDEGRTFLKYGAQPLSVGLTQYDEPGNHVFHTLLVHIAYQFFGASENWVVRLPAFIAGVLVIPATYAVGTVLYNRSAGVVASALVSASTVMIAYSVNARGYTLICLFSLLLVLLGSHLKQRPSGFGWLTFAVLGALGFYTIPTMLFPYTACMVWLFIWIWFSEKQARRQSLLIQLFVSGLVTSFLTILLYLPVIQASGLESLVSNDYVRARPWPEFWGDVRTLPRDLWRFATREIPLPVQLVLGAAILVGLLPRTGERKQVHILAVTTVCVTLLITIAQRVVGYDRVMLFILPLFAVVAGVGVVRVLDVVVKRPERRPGAVGFVSLAYAVGVGALVIASGDLAESSFVEMEDMTTDIQAVIRPTDGVATIMRTHNYEFYMAQHEFPANAISYSTTDVQRVYLAVSDGGTPEAVLEFNSLQPDDFAAPKLLQDNSYYDLYVVDRLAES